MAGSPWSVALEIDRLRGVDRGVGEPLLHPATPRSPLSPTKGQLTARSPGDEAR